MMNFLLQEFLKLADPRDIQHIFYTLFARWSRHDTNQHEIVYLNCSQILLHKNDIWTSSFLKSKNYFIISSQKDFILKLPFFNFKNYSNEPFPLKNTCTNSPCFDCIELYSRKLESLFLSSAGLNRNSRCLLLIWGFM